MAKIRAFALSFLIITILLFSACGGETTVTSTITQMQTETQTITPVNTVTQQADTPTKSVTSTVSNTITSTITTTSQPPTTTTQTPISSEITRTGHINENETWFGTVHITGEVFIDEGVTLTILPGTTVLFVAHQDDQQFGSAVPIDEWIAQHNDPTATLEYAESHIAIRGKIIAQGTPEDMITFTSDSPTPDGGDWLHLHPSSGSIFEYCIIEYSRAGLAIPESTGDTLLISHNILRHNLWTALTVESCSPTITHNDIYHSGGHQGIAIIGEGSSPLIAYNQIKHCKVGMVIAEGATPNIEHNVIIDNDFGFSVQSNAVIRNNSISSPNGAQYDFTYKGVPVYFASKNQGQYSEIEGITIINASPNITNNELFSYPRGIGLIGNCSPTIIYNKIISCQEGGAILFGASFNGDPQINENNIYDNSVNISLELGFHGSIDATNNWWGTTEVADIADKIRDINDNPSLGIILYEPFLTEPVNITL
jgi:hypothetical protein